MNYKTYAEAKIANPDSEIVTTGKNWDRGENRKGLFESLRFYSDVADHKLSDDAWVICNPADHCSSLKEFLDTGFKLVCGDKIQTSKKSIFTITVNNSGFNNKDGARNEVFILSATALNGGCKIPAKAEQGTVYDNTAQQFEELASDKPVKPVFTQAMAQAGELPSLGSEVALRYKFDSKQIHIVGKVLYASMENCIIDGQHKECHYKMCHYTYESIPKTITVNGFEVQEPVREEINKGEWYYAASVLSRCFYEKLCWIGDSTDSYCLSRGIIHSNKYAAIAHAKAMLGIAPNA